MRSVKGFKEGSESCRQSHHNLKRAACQNMYTGHYGFLCQDNYSLGPVKSWTTKRTRIYKLKLAKEGELGLICFAVPEAGALCNTGPGRIPGNP